MFFFSKPVIGRGRKQDWTEWGAKPQCSLSGGTEAEWALQVVRVWGRGYLGLGRGHNLGLCSSLQQGPFSKRADSQQSLQDLGISPSVLKGTSLSATPCNIHGTCSTNDVVVIIIGHNSRPGLSHFEAGAPSFCLPSSLSETLLSPLLPEFE